MPTEQSFYVYEHWTPDKCFYVGMGHGKRAYKMRRRGPGHARVLAEIGKAEVRIIADGLTRTEALTLEIERIAFWGPSLTNRTYGGAGCSHPHTEVTKARLRAARAKQTIIITAEMKAKIGAASKRNGISAATREGHKASMTGRKWDPNVVEKRIAPLRGRRRPDDVVARAIEALRSDEVRAKMSFSQRRRRRREAEARLCRP